MATIVFTFLRGNPPTKGHELVLQTGISVAKQNGGQFVVFLSQTQDNDQNPLSWNDKINFFRRFFPGLNISTAKQAKDPFQALKLICEAGNQDVFFIVGDDRLNEFTQRMSPYAQKWGAANFQVLSAGGRDSSSEDIDGISATKARQAVRDNNYKLFSTLVPDTAGEKVKKQLFDTLKKTLFPL